jgi:hypothetical protein
MRIRAGFVSNSSSTSFLIISDGDLTQSKFRELMGVDAASPIACLFEQLFNDVTERRVERVDFSEIDASLPVQTWFDRSDGLSAAMVAKLEGARARGLTAYYGYLNSDNNAIQSWFCTDSFEVENDKIYFNALSCAW